ncbi:MAG: hypothetical protein E6Q77_05615 [Rhizobium sp.]|nr:MAG: hypothetical protein E6Q77_05615 [Rhizobium sp.]
MFTTVAFAALFSVSAMAQTATAPSTTPATTPSATTSTPSTTTMTKPKAAKPAQTAVSKACSTQADAKGLHGKARSKFRSDCKKNGGKAA